MVEQFIKAIRYVRENVKPEDYSVYVGFSTSSPEELASLVKVTGWSSHDYLPESNCHIVKIGPNIKVFCYFNPKSVLYHGSVMPHEIQPCLSDPSAAAGLVYGVVGFDKFNEVHSHISCYYLSPERAVQLASDLSFCGETIAEEYDDTKWLSCGPFISLFLLQESDLAYQRS